jgi:hypothetical protein
MVRTCTPNRRAVPTGMAAIALLAVFVAASVARDVRITVHSGESGHTWMGMGGSATHNDDGSAANYNNLPQDFRDEMANFFWRDGGFRILRI